MGSKINFYTPVTQVPLVGPAYARRLEKLGVRTVGDLLHHLPFRYDDYSVVSKIKDLQDGETVTVQGQVLEIKNLFTRRGFVLQKARVQDDTGTLDVLWFNQRFLTSTIKKGDQISLSGKVKGHQLESPDYEIIRGPTIHTGRLVPVYPETAGLSSKWLRSRIANVLKLVEITEFLPNTDMMGEEEAVKHVHFPESLAQAAKAKERLAFDELLTAQLTAKQRRKDWQERTVGNKFKIVEVKDKLGKMVKSLPFELTRSQKKVINEIYQDLARDTPMNRLLQGDVGSGKTVVAALAMLATNLNGLQSVLMAPTEILAHQHYQTLTKLLKPLKIGVGIATGATKDYSGFDVVVGTHALISKEINFKKLGLVVIDESHRFGVEQKALLTAKGVNPHVLTMTATPIPRTVALTLYGDLDISILDEMPVGRLPVKTWVVPAAKRDAAYQWIRRQKSQTFIICPLVEESETLESVKSAKAEFARLAKDVFPDLRLGLVHGRLKAAEKNRVLSAFKDQKIDTLVATPVVEVGLDIPTATIMVIEGAERFGLAALHQLRGRVGRGEQQSFCLLFADNATSRLKYLEKLNDGLKLAEIDLTFRGPGQRYGTAQHGKWDLAIADFSNLQLVEQTNDLAQKVLAQPDQFPLLLDRIKKSKINVVPN